jgi:hypothetical protein
MEEVSMTDSTHNFERKTKETKSIDDPQKYITQNCAVV